MEREPDPRSPPTPAGRTVTIAYHRKAQRIRHHHILSAVTLSLGLQCGFDSNLAPSHSCPGPRLTFFSRPFQISLVFVVLLVSTDQPTSSHEVTNRRFVIGFARTKTRESGLHSCSGDVESPMVSLEPVPCSRRCDLAQDRKQAPMRS